MVAVDMPNTSHGCAVRTGAAEPDVGQQAAMERRADHRVVRNRIALERSPSARQHLTQFIQGKGPPFSTNFSSAKRTYFARQTPARTAEASTSRPSGRTRKRATRLAPRRLLWNIEGQRGRIYSIPGPLGDPGREGFQFFLACDSGLAWTHAKRALKFAKVCNDSDEGGGFIMHRLPTKTEAESGTTAAFPSAARSASRQPPS